MRGTIIIQTLYDFPRSFSWRVFAHLEEGLYQAIILSSERGKSYKFCMMPSKIYGKLYDFHSSLIRHQAFVMSNICENRQISSYLCVQVRCIIKTTILSADEAVILFDE